MRLAEWCAKAGRSGRWLAQAAGVGHGTAQRAIAGRPVRTIRVARALSEATGGDVSTSELERGEATPTATP